MFYNTWGFGHMGRGEGTHVLGGGIDVGLDFDLRSGKHILGGVFFSIRDQNELDKEGCLQRVERYLFEVQSLFRRECFVKYCIGLWGGGAAGCEKWQ